MILIRISVENGVELAMATRILFPLAKAASRTSSKKWGFLLIYVCHRDLGQDTLVLVLSVSILSRDL